MLQSSPDTDSGRAALTVWELNTTHAAPPPAETTLIVRSTLPPSSSWVTPGENVAVSLSLVGEFWKFTVKSAPLVKSAALAGAARPSSTAVVMMSFVRIISFPFWAYALERRNLDHKSAV